MSIKMIGIDVDVFCSSFSDYFKTKSGIILTSCFSYQLGQQKAFVGDDNMINCHLLNAIVV